MKIKNHKKLMFSKETVRALSRSELNLVNGGSANDPSTVELLGAGSSSPCNVI